MHEYKLAWQRRQLDGGWGGGVFWPIERAITGTACRFDPDCFTADVNWRKPRRTLQGRQK